MNLNFIFFEKILSLKFLFWLGVLLATLIPSAKVVAQAKFMESRSTDGETPIAVQTELAIFQVSVVDVSGRSVSGLKTGNFRVYDDGKLQNISFFGDDDASLAIGVVYDNSGSMATGKSVRAQKSLNQFFERVRTEDDIFLLELGDSVRARRVRILQEESLPTIKFASPDGPTALYDAVYLGIETLRKSSQPKKVLVIISDGEDNASRCNLKEISRFIQESGVTVYTIATGGNSPVSRNLRSGQENLQEIAAISGGRAFSPVSDFETDIALDQISREMRQLYSIGFYPMELDRRLKHGVKINVISAPIGLRVVARHRKVYYSKSSSKD